MTHDGYQEAVDMLISGVVVLLKCLIALGQIDTELRRIIPLHRRVIVMIRVIFVIGEASELLISTCESAV
jgi:hypothetical protein